MRAAVYAYAVHDVDELTRLRAEVAELRLVRAAADKLVDLLQRLAKIQDDAELGRELRAAMRTQPLFAVSKKT